MKAYWGMEFISKIFISAVDRGEWSALHLATLAKGKEPLVHIG